MDNSRQTIHGEMMNNTEFRLVASRSEFEALDELLWEVLWKPIGLPRNIRDSFKIEGEGVDIVALCGENVVGGLVANWVFPIEVELRHLAVIPEAQGNKVGSNLVKKLISMASQRNCLTLWTISRNTSTQFFKKLGFKPGAEKVPDHPSFKKHGISFEKLEFMCKTNTP